MIMRRLFPTIGRSDGVMVGIRAKLQKLRGGSIDAGEAPKLQTTGKSDIEEKVSDWSEARLQRRLVLLRAACLGKHNYNGPKKLALARLLKRASERGRTILVVLPVPPIYQKSLLSANSMQEFQNELSELQRLCPDLEMVRLDKLPALDRDDLYYDYVHLNRYGQEIATHALLARLEARGIAH